MLPELFVKADFDKYLWENELWRLLAPAVNRIEDSAVWDDMRHDKEQSVWAMAHQALSLVKKTAEEDNLLSEPSAVALFEGMSVKILQRFYTTFERFYRQNLIKEGGPIADDYLNNKLGSERGVLEAISKLESHYGLLTGGNYGDAIELYISDLAHEFISFLKDQVEWPEDVWADEASGNGTLSPLFQARARDYLNGIVSTYIDPSRESRALAKEDLARGDGPSWGELMVHTPDAQDALDSIVESSTALDELGLAKTAELLDYGLQAIAQTPGGQVSHVTEVAKAIANLANNMLMELRNLKAQNITAIPPSELTKFQQQNHALGGNIARLQTLIKDR